MNTVCRPSQLERPSVVDGVSAAARASMVETVDSLSVDGRTAVKLMIPSFRFTDAVSTAAAAGYRPTWIDAVDYHQRVYFNVIFTRNDDEVRS